MHNPKGSFIDAFDSWNAKLIHLTSVHFLLKPEWKPFPRKKGEGNKRIEASLQRNWVTFSSLEKQGRIHNFNHCSGQNVYIYVIYTFLRSVQLKTEPVLGQVIFPLFFLAISSRAYKAAKGIGLENTSWHITDGAWAQHKRG